MFSHFLKYLLGDIGVKLLGFASLPIFTYFLAPSEYGIFSLFSAYVSILGIVLTLNTHTAIGRFYYEKNIDHKSLLDTTILLSVFMLFISFNVMYFLGNDLLTKLLSFDFDKYGIYFCLLIVFNTFFLIYTQTLIPQQKSKEYTFLKMLKAYIGFAVVVAFLYFVNNGALERIYGLVVIEFFFFLYIGYKLLKDFKPIIKINDIKYIISYSLPMLPYVLAGAVMSQIDRIMLADFVSMSEVGIYSVTYRLSFIPMLLFASIGKAWTPYYFKYMDAGNHQKLTMDTIKILLFITFLILTIALFSKEIVFILLNNKFIEVKYLLPILTFSTLFTVLWQIWGRSIGYAKKTIWISYIGFFSALVNIMLNYYLIPIYKIQGAMYATLVSYMVMAFLGYFVAKYYLKIYTVSITDLRYVFGINIFIFAVVICNNEYVFIILKIIYFFVLGYLGYKYRNLIYKYLKKIKPSNNSQ